MRLTKLKLAGFKSFVDPVTVAFPGQLAGVVGPNGCGKSNIIDAVRWVLGESRASELRGESMQDVIFNGTTDRKPVARASVELVFDNTSGRALGQWSQYAELSVKRVLTRNGQSDYFINNLKVRRKDITDLFLGTGLGPRAYAIIGQGMISRVIEARPDDLRVFLEEAAGVTRYKERRKETEGRLEDTRENLARVEDIRLELSAQMEKLNAQAEVARQYQTLTAELTQKQQFLWLTRKNEAQSSQQKLALEVARADTELEAATAALRETETTLLLMREAHFAASDAVHQAQSALYSVNAEVTRLEAEIRHRQEIERQLAARLAQLAGEEAHWRERTEELATDAARWESLRDLADARRQAAGARQEASAQRLQQARAEQEAARAEADRLRGEAARAEQALQVERAHRTHVERNLQGLLQRQELLQREAAAQTAPEKSTLETKEAELASMQAALVEVEANLRAAQEQLPRQEAERQTLAAHLEARTLEAAAIEARLQVLTKMQKTAAQAGNLPQWLQRYGLADATPLWRALRVKPGWETAVEAVLRERLEALPATREVMEEAAQWAENRPGGKLTLRLPQEVMDAPPADVAANRLFGQVEVEDAAWRPLLAAWLGRSLVAENLPAALVARTSLPPGCHWVTPAGDRVERQALSLFAPDAAGHGLLERQREIETLEEEGARLRQTLEENRAELARRDADCRAGQEKASALRREQGALQARAHAAQVEILKHAQALERHQADVARRNAQATELEREAQTERERAAAIEESLVALQAQTEAGRAAEGAARARLEAAERALNDAREQAAAAERETHEAEFSQRECAGKLAEIAAGLALAQREAQRVAADLTACRAQEADTPPETFAEALQEALEKRVQCETDLAARRNGMEGAADALRAGEEERLRIEQSLEPLRKRIGDLRLKEQAAALSAAQLAAQLQEAGADEEALSAALAANPARPQALTQNIEALQKAIHDLGAVNLAALEELETASARKGYLDAQAADLVEAMATLEDAIRRIDRETRQLLQGTFEAVNGHFGRLFPELFGGGRAALVMTGEEILDAGVQVFAQPPGKKNSTIHLLSGGEKALTAIALVFSLFLLNPAPFCLLDEVDAPLDDSNTERFCQMVKKMSGQTQFLFISHNKIAMEMASQLVGVTMQESGVSRVVEVDMEAALKMREES
ncbi:MAG: chromosome segregation protein SMC [Zoogloeaceae bacterium]|jgi:chromosome segregation protein|nr:chromosome segregation protein SMC [Zoogloeaceae bacterium]